MAYFQSEKNEKIEIGDEVHKKIKSKIQDFETYFSDNKKRHSQFVNYVYKSTISNELRGMMQSLGMPVVEANILYPYVAKTAGEFLKNEPSVIIKQSDSQDIDSEKLLMLGNYIRHKFDEANKNYTGYENFKLALAGGYSVFEVCTKYRSKYSFQREPFIEKIDPIMSGFDPMAKNKTKSDGRYCYKICYMTKDDFKLNYKDIDIPSVGIRDFMGLSPVPSIQEKYVVYCEFYEKKQKRKKIYLLSDGNSVTKKEYEQLQKFYADTAIMSPLPEILDEKYEYFDEIYKYCLTNNKIFKAEKTNYEYLPLVFCDGDSIVSSDGNDTQKQFTRPFVMTAKGAQDFKNISMMYWADNVTNRSRSKILISEDNIPSDQGYKETITNPHKKGSIVVKDISKITHYTEPDTNSDVIRAFENLDATIQSTIGGFGSNVGNSDLNLSGRAVVELNTMGNASSVPYFESMMASYNQIAIIIASLATKLYTNETQITVLNDDMQKENKVIPAGYFKIKHEDLDICVSSSLNFDVQKRLATEEIKGLMQSSPAFADFMNSAGLSVLIKNMSIYAKDELLQLVKNYEEQNKQSQSQQSIMQQQQQDIAMQTQQLQLQEKQAEIQKIMSEIQIMQEKINIEKQKLESEKYIASIDATVKMADQQNKRTLVESQLIKETNEATQSKIKQALEIEKHEISQQNHMMDFAGKMIEVESRNQNKGDEYGKI